MEIVLLTDYRGALRQRQQIWESMDVEKIRALLSDAGIGTEVHRFEDVASGGVRLQDRIIHYTSTQDAGYRPFVDDILFHLDRDNTLLPRYEIFRAHENKGFQELLRRRLDLPALPAAYFGNEKGLDGFAEDFTYPKVFKATSGYQSTGVQLVRSADDLRAVVHRLNRPAGLAKYRLKEGLKKNVLRDRYHPEMYEDCVHTGPYVVQDFVPGAAGDWKVLIFGDRFYVLRRLVRAGDFRASGSGRFSYDTPPGPVLDLAADVFRKLDVPVASLDILEHEGACHLIEFQGMHFGTMTIDRAPHRFERQGGDWSRIVGPANLEEEYARSLRFYLQR